MKGGFRRRGDSSLVSRAVFLRVGWRRGRDGGERVRDLRFVGVEVEEGFRCSGDKVLFLWSENWVMSTGFRRSGEIVRARSSALRSMEALGEEGELTSLVVRIEESRASIISDVRSIERPLACRSSGSFSLVSASRTGETGGKNSSCSAKREVIFRI